MNLMFIIREEFIEVLIISFIIPSDERSYQAQTVYCYNPVYSYRSEVFFGTLNQDLFFCNTILSLNTAFVTAVPALNSRTSSFTIHQIDVSDRFLLLSRSYQYLWII
jgi:hypothetical protein